MRKPGASAARDDGLRLLAGFLFALWLALAITWVARRGPTQLLWFCDVSLLATCAGLYFRNAHLVTAQLVAVVLFHFGWHLEFWLYLVAGRLPLGATAYMFFPNFGLWEKTISFLSHTLVVPATLYGSLVLGAPRSAWRVQAVQTAAVFGLTLALTSPAENINWLFGTEFFHPATPGPSVLYTTAMILGLPLLVYWPVNRLATPLVRRFAPIDRLKISSARLAGLLLATTAASFALSLHVDRAFGLEPHVLAPLSPSSLGAQAGLQTSTIVDRFRLVNDPNRLAELLPYPLATLPLVRSEHRGTERVHLRPILRTVPADSLPSVPQEMLLEGSRSVSGSIVYGVVASDGLYLQPIGDLHRFRNRFVVRLQMGGPGISEFVDPQTGRMFAPSEENEILGYGLGGIYAVAAVEVLDRKVVARSPFYLAKRQGIRLPEDVWSIVREGRNVPLLIREPTRAWRVAFQSVPEPGEPPDIFVSDFFGYNLKNLTGTPRRFEGFAGPGGASCGRIGWWSASRLRYCAERGGHLNIVERAFTGS